MNQSGKGKLQRLLELRELTVDELMQKLSERPALKFVLTTAGIWFLFRWAIGLWIGVHVIYLIYHIFDLVLN